MKKLLVVGLLFSISFSALADSRQEKLQTLMEAQGLLSMFEEQLAMSKVQSKKMGKQALDQFLSQLNPSEEFKEKFSSAFEDYLDKLSSPWGADEIVEVWGKYYGKEFSEKELDALIEFYSSPLGQKEVAASRSALSKFTAHFQELGQPIFKKATQEYIAELKLIAKECNCRK